MAPPPGVGSYQTRARLSVHLTRTEWALLELLMTQPGRLLTHDWILRHVWGSGYAAERGYLRTFIRQLRHKLGDEAIRRRLILTEPSMGYRWIASG